MKYYNGRIPACGIYCGGCPVYTREKRTCPGAELNCARCDNCKSFHLCCQKRGITHCHECSTFPCRRLKDFSKRWEKYGQNMIENQKQLAKMGTEKFLSDFQARSK